MSLKAKLEAVIYAAEEPVTLAQLAALFSSEALEWKAAHEAASSIPDPVEDESLPILNAELDFAEMEQPSTTAQNADEAPNEPSEAEVPASPAQDATAAESAAQPSPEATSDPTPADLEAEAKRLARLREREVRTILRALLDELIATYASDDRGIEIKEIAGGFRMATKPECHDAARMFVKSLKPALKLSLPALETLAVIAYKQPVTAPEVNEIRGVDSSGVFGSLLARKLISTAGRKQVIGRPILYKTTKEFLLKFGLNDVTELPSMEEFEKMAQLEFEDMEPLEEADAGAGEPGIPEVDDDPDAPGESPIPEEAPIQEQPADPDPLEDPREDPDGDPDKSPVSEPPAATQQSEPASEQEGTHRQEQPTAATADSPQTPAFDEPETTETPAETPATQAATTPAEAAPAPPSNLEHAETETVPHD